MMLHKFYMTTTARDHLKDVVRETKRKWGPVQARKYNADFQLGLNNLAKNHRILVRHSGRI